MTELKIENKQVIALDEKGYRIVFVTKPIVNRDFKETEEIAKKFFSTFELNNISIPKE